MPEPVGSLPRTPLDAPTAERENALPPISTVYCLGAIQVHELGGSGATRRKQVFLPGNT